MLDCKPCTTLMATSPPPSKYSGDPFPDGELYRQVVGALQYITMTRLDASFSVNRLCQFMYCPSTTHWQVVKRLLWYLKHTQTQGLFFSKTSPLHLQYFSDSDWGGCPDDRCSTNGYAIYLGATIISWQAKKQNTIARSSMESEYKALANGTAELVWLQSLLSELYIYYTHPATLWCDNIGAIYLSSNPVFHARMKHIELDFHFVRELVKNDKI